MDTTTRVDLVMTAAEWVALGEFLADDSHVLVTGERRLAFCDDWESISRKERDLDDRLFVGLVGGTGVGKSTLINAIAGESISTSGDRRPTTDRVVVYRHADSDLPERIPGEGLATPQKAHQNAALDKLVFFDFPDFDSVEAEHARIFARFAPHLDLTLVLLDETKYADQVLFDRLADLPQNRENLYLVWNKIDRLEARYGDGAAEVLSELWRDFGEKLWTRLAWSPEAEHKMAVSAAVAFGERSSGDSTAEGSRGRLEPLLSLFDGYRSEKRRRAAKAMNIEALRAGLIHGLTETYLEPSAPADATRARARLGVAVRDIEEILSGIPRTILSRRERRAVESETFRRVRGSLGFPMDVMLSLLNDLRTRRASGRSPSGDLLRDRFRAHYASFYQALELNERRYREEVGDALSGHARERAAESTPGEKESRWSSALEAETERRLRPLLRLRFVKNHFLPCMATAVYLWALVRPLVLEWLEAEKVGESIDWPAALLGVVTGLNPMWFFLYVGTVVLLYLLGALVLHGRLTHRVEEAVSRVEEGPREKARQAIDGFATRFTGEIEAWEAEREQLEGLTGG